MIIKNKNSKKKNKKLKKKIKKREKEKEHIKKINSSHYFRWWFTLVELYIFECKSLNFFLKSCIIINIYFVNFWNETLLIKIKSNVTSVKI